MSREGVHPAEIEQLARCFALYNAHYLYLQSQLRRIIGERAKLMSHDQVEYAVDEILRSRGWSDKQRRDSAKSLKEEVRYVLVAVKYQDNEMHEVYAIDVDHPLVVKAFDTIYSKSMKRWLVHNHATMPFEDALAEISRNSETHWIAPEFGVGGVKIVPIIDSEWIVNFEAISLHFCPVCGDAFDDVPECECDIDWNDDEYEWQATQRGEDAY